MPLWACESSQSRIWPMEHIRVLMTVPLALHLCPSMQASGARGPESHRHTKKPTVLSRKLHLEGVRQPSVPDTPELGLPSWHTGPALCPNISLSAPHSVLLPADLLGARGAATSILLAGLPGWQPWHTGCPVCQLGTLAKYPCLKPGLWHPFSITSGKERAGVGGVSAGGEWARIQVERFLGLTLGRLKNGMFG